MTPRSRLASTTILGGGLDLVSPPVALKPGSLIACCNYEATDSGYRRCDGFERFDGQPKPSEAVYAWLSFTNGNELLVAGTAVRGETSHATGTLLIDMVIESGSVGASNAVGYYIITNVSGTFEGGENIQVQN